MTSRRVLQAAALLFAALEFVNIFLIDFPVAAAVFAALFLVGWWWLRRGGVAGAVLIGVLCLIELVFLFAYSWTSIGDWINQGLAALLGVVGLAAAIAVVASGRRRGAGSADE